MYTEFKTLSCVDKSLNGISSLVLFERTAYNIIGNSNRISVKYCGFVGICCRHKIKTIVTTTILSIIISYIGTCAPAVQTPPCTSTRNTCYPLQFTPKYQEYLLLFLA